MLRLCTLKTDIVDPPLGRLTELANDARHPNWNNRCRLAGGHSPLQLLSEKYCYSQQFPRMRPCERNGNRNGRRHQLVELPQATPLLVVPDRSGWRCWLRVGETARRAPSTSGSYRFHPRPSAYRDRSRLDHQLGLRSSCRSSSASSGGVNASSSPRHPRAKCRETNIHPLTLGRGSHHKLAEQGWTTRIGKDGVTEWIPPPHLDHGQPRTNTFHHPEKLLRDDEDDDEP